MHTMATVTQQSLIRQASRVLVRARLRCGQGHTSKTTQLRIKAHYFTGLINFSKFNKAGLFTGYLGEVGDIKCSVLPNLIIMHTGTNRDSVPYIGRGGVGGQSFSHVHNLYSLCTHSNQKHTEVHNNFEDNSQFPARGITAGVLKDI